jgi:membrane-associated phospholipid phosphatase
VNGALVTAAKYLVQRPLPRTYAGDPGLVNSPGGYRSFYSGHASTAAAALGVVAMTLRYRYDQKVWPWFVAGGIEALIGFERVRAGRHFPSDVLVGALAGTAVGIAVPALHHRAPSIRLSALPLAGGGYAALSLAW